MDQEERVQEQRFLAEYKLQHIYSGEASGNFVFPIWQTNSLEIKISPNELCLMHIVFMINLKEKLTFKKQEITY